MTSFDLAAITLHDWRQGAVLGPTLASVARELAPSGIEPSELDWLIVVSHDCDVVNGRLEKEPTVELLLARVIEGRRADKQQAWGRNPRQLQLDVDGVVLDLSVHDRWTLPREHLASEAPQRHLPDKTKRVIAEWLAKRYIRAAFPTAFDARGRDKMRDWTRLLEKHSEWIQGVYLRLNTLAELDSSKPYRLALLIAAPSIVSKKENWRRKREELVDAVETFWSGFGSGIVLDDVDVATTDTITLADLEQYQRFDVDWVSFADDTPWTPNVVEFRS